jgi:hypothetical protein
MTALWLEPARHSAPLDGPLDPERVRTGLRLVEGDRRRRVDELDGSGIVDPWAPDSVVAPQRRTREDLRRRPSLEVRRRRTLFAVMGLLLIALALPLSGTGGSSHTTGSAPVEISANGAGVYTVKPGDTLWSIAERMDPSADPRPIVAQLAKETGSDTVTPGERITLP